ncbi:MAG: hypothetical protein IH801_08005 [Nitrospinae bacterium]|nr:hypothetical protein [Nitrospinota bacterium]
MRPKPPTVALYVSGHGFGHAVRCAELIRSLWASEPSLGVVVKTAAPAWLFSALAGREVAVEPLECDVGVAQTDSLHVDKSETLKQVRAFFSAWDGLVAQEASACRKAGVRLIVGDIPAVAFRIASVLGVPGLALANFAWDWIYEAYAAEDGEFAEFVPPLREAYGLATLLLKLPMSPGMGAFAAQRPIPLLVRTTDEPRDELRRRLGLGRGERVVLLTFGGIGFGGLDLEALGRLENFRFLVFDEAAEAAPDNVTVLAHRCDNHHELVRAADIVVSKPGYGVVSECLAAGTPILYTSRGDFAEYPLLVEAIEAHLPNRFVPREEFVEGRWTHLLGELSEWRPEGPVVDCSGGEVAARAILEHLG